MKKKNNKTESQADEEALNAWDRLFMTLRGVYGPDFTTSIAVHGGAVRVLCTYSTEADVDFKEEWHIG